MKKFFLIFIILISLDTYASIENDFKVAIKYISENNTLKAKEKFENIIKEKPKNNYEKNIVDKANYNLALIYSANGNKEKAKHFFEYVSSNVENRTSEAINSNQKLLSYAITSNDYNEAINQAERLNKRTMYLELPFLANLIYLYELDNDISKIERINNNVISELNEKEKGKLYNLIANIYLENKDFDKSGEYFNKLLLSTNIENKQLGYIGFSNIEYLNDNKSKSMEYANKAVKLAQNNSSILEQIQIIFANNQEYEKSYEVLKQRLKIEKNPNILVEALRYSDYLSKLSDEDIYIKELEKLINSNYDLGLTFMVYRIYDMAEKYLLKAVDEGDLRAYNQLLTLYFGIQSSTKIINLIDIMVKNNVITSEKRKILIKEYEQYLEYIKKN